MADTEPLGVDAAAIKRAIDYGTAVALAAHGVKSLDTEVWHDVGGSFSCSEADALAALLVAVGLPEHADALRTGHAAQDELGDLHYRRGSRG